MTKTTRTIKSQGDLDSACFLYSLVNAAQCLSGKILKDKDWGKLISGTYDCRDFLTGNTGTKRIDHIPELISTLTAEYLKLLDQKTKYHVKEIKKNSELKTTLSERSLLIIDNGVHWFCLLDVDDEYAYIACSAVWQKDPRSYTEAKTMKLNRTYNDKFPVAELEVLEGRVLLVSICYD